MLTASRLVLMLCSQIRSLLPGHRRVEYRYGFIYSQYKPDAWYWEEIELLRKYILTSVIIFVKPGTTAQLATAFVITLCFLVLHVQTYAFDSPEENRTQLCGLTSIMLLLFSGILLRANKFTTEPSDDDDASQAAITFVIIFSQVAVLLMFVIETYKIFTDNKERFASSIEDGEEATDTKVEKTLKELQTTIEELCQDGSVPRELAELPQHFASAHKTGDWGDKVMMLAMLSCKIEHAAGG